MVKNHFQYVEIVIKQLMFYILHFLLFLLSVQKQCSLFSKELLHGGNIEKIASKLKFSLQNKYFVFFRKSMLRHYVIISQYVGILGYIEILYITS